MKNIILKIKDIICDTSSLIWNYSPFVATRGYILNKFISVIVFVLMMAHYKSLDSQPFIELYYVAITVFGVALLGPLLRLVLFVEAAEYGEAGKLRSDLKSNKSTVSLKHYWFATAISYLIPVLCFATIAK